MVNTNIQGAIPLTGKGHTFRNKGEYLRGEYKQLVNAEIIEDRITDRRNVRTTGNGSANESFSLTNPLGIVGNIEQWSIFVSKTVHYAVGQSDNITCWAPTSLPVPAGGFHRIVGAFKYNRVFYWVTLEYNPTGTVYKYCLYWVQPAFGAGIGSITFASLTRTEIITITNEYFPNTRAIYMFKDRLWVTTQSKVYFSKATDPKDFTIPNGGFLAVPDTVIRHSFSLSDSVYILTDSSIHAFSYSADPNQDGYIRPIALGIGGLWGVAHRSTPYFVNRQGLFVINSGSVEKVHDLYFDIRSGGFELKIESFENYIILLRRNLRNYDNLGLLDAKFLDNLGYFWEQEPANEVFWNVFFINTENGSAFALDFTDCNDLVDTTLRGYVVDIYNNPEKDFFGTNYLCIHTNRYISGAGPWTYKGSTYIIVPNRPEIFIFDEARKANDVKSNYKHRIQTIIEGWTPDGSEHLQKKFRNLLGQGKFPNTDFQVSVSFDNAVYHAPILVGNVNFTNNHPHYPMRVGLNQRARSMNIKFETTNNDTVLGSGIYDQFELSDLRVLWQATQRALTHKTMTDTNLGKDY